MLQANSAGSTLPGVAIEMAPGNTGMHADDSGAFSQEFDKQIKNTANSGADKSRNGAPKRASDEPEPKAKQTDGSADAQAAEKHDAEAAAEQEAAKDGKSLPQEGAEQAESGAQEKLTDTQQEMAILTLPHGAERRAEVTADALKGRGPLAGEGALAVRSGQLASASGAEATEDGLAGDDVLQLRDVMAQRMLAGNGQGDGAGARQGKPDLNLLLPAQTAAARGAGGFEEALRFSSVTGMPGQVVPGQATGTAPVALTLAVPMQQPGWDQAMGERVVWMARSNLQQAEIQLNPRELGPIEIKISMQKEHANVNFVAHHAATREAIEAAIPRLREMFSEQGLNLGQADVSQHSFGDGGKQAADANGNSRLPGGAGGEVEGELAEEGVAATQVGYVSASGVDYFA